jgi:DNA-binding protein HU-beta
MTKQQLVDAVSTATEQNKSQVEATLDALIAEIGKALKSGARVDLRGFGSFVVKDKPARQGRNPRTGETIQIPARTGGDDCDRGGNAVGGIGATAQPANLSVG